MVHQPEYSPVGTRFLEFLEVNLVKIYGWKWILFVGLVVIVVGEFIGGLIGELVTETWRVRVRELLH
ncbi:hypothetical protein Hanom_Chr08g00754151 [Helianthus anomalus]